MIHQGKSYANSSGGMFANVTFGEAGKSFASWIKYPSQSPAGKFEFKEVVEQEGDGGEKQLWTECTITMEIQECTLDRLRQYLWLSRGEVELSAQVLGGGANANKFLNFNGSTTPTLSLEVSYVNDDTKSIATLTFKTRLTGEEMVALEDASASAYTGGAGSGVTAGSTYGRNKVLTPGVESIGVTNADGAALVGYINTSSFSLKTFGGKPQQPRGHVFAKGVEIELKATADGMSANDLKAFQTSTTDRVDVVYTVPDGISFALEHVLLTYGAVYSNNIEGSGVPLSVKTKVPFVGGYTSTSPIDMGITNPNQAIFKNVSNQAIVL